MLRLVVTGGRYFNDKALVVRSLGLLHQRDGIHLLIHGDATGADRLCAFWAMGNDVDCQPCPAAWNDVDVPGAVVRYRRDGSPYNVLAGFQRNQQMIDVWCPNYAVAFPGNNGTADMVQRIKAANLPLWDLRQEYG